MWVFLAPLTPPPAVPMAQTKVAPAKARTFEIVGSEFRLDGKKFTFRSGEIHPQRVPPPYWRQRLKMAKAMGLNAISIYVFWNLIEPKPGKVDFTGQNDIARFVRMAGEEGLWVIARPGPYVCAEMDLGGYPAWLLKDRSFRIRSNDPGFMAHVRRYYADIGRQLRPLLLKNGGPILMAQLENEYGSYGSDKAYLTQCRDAMRAGGLDCPLFTSDGPGESYLRAGTLPNVNPVVNAGGGLQGAIDTLRRFRADTPPMIGEFWAGWFDQWGKRHQRSNLRNNLRDLEYALRNDVSFNLYMFHGGTNWGFLAGANGGSNNYDLDTTSYDYDAALDESGRPTPKYRAFRDLIARYDPTPLPPVPKTAPTIAIKPFRLIPAGGLGDQKPARVVSSRVPMSFEDLGQNFGFVKYRHLIAKPGRYTLAFSKIRGFALVSLDAERVGTLDRRLNQREIILDVSRPGTSLEIVVEAQGRINFGGEIPNERLGIEGPTLDGRPLLGWENQSFPMDAPPTDFPRMWMDLPDPTFYRATISVPAPGDTFLDTRGWSKGYVWINGKNLGRYWNIGPQGTLFVPGVWLKKGINDVVVLDLGLAPVAKPTMQGLREPLLDIFTRAAKRHRKPGQSLDTQGLTPVFASALANDAQAQTVPITARGRYLALEVMSEYGPGDFSSLAELWAVGADGKDLDRKDWRVLYASTEETEAESADATNVFDLQPTTFWHSGYSQGAEKRPHVFVIDFGSVRDLSALRFLPRQDGNVNGRIKDVRVFVSETPFRGL